MEFDVVRILILLLNSNFYDYFIQRTHTNTSSSLNLGSSNLIVQQCGAQQPQETDQILAIGNQAFPNEFSQDILVKIKEENKLLRKAIVNMNARLGDEIISDAESDSTLEEYDMHVNTRNYQRDLFFAEAYDFITNVSLHTCESFGLDTLLF